MPKQTHIVGRLSHSGGSGLVENADVRLIWTSNGEERVEHQRTTPAGLFDFKLDCEEGTVLIQCAAFGRSCRRELTVERDHPPEEIALDLDLGFKLTIHHHAGQDERLVPTAHAVVGRRVVVRVETDVDACIESYLWKRHHDAQMTGLDREAELVFVQPGRFVIEATIVEKRDQPEKARAKALLEFAVSDSDVQKIGGHIRVTMERTPSEATLDQALWVAIRERTRAISFDRYVEFIDRVLEQRDNDVQDISRRALEFRFDLPGVNAYRCLKFITNAFLVMNCGVSIDPRRRDDRFDPREEEWRLGRPYSRDEIERELRRYLGEDGQLPYLRRVIEAAYPEFQRDGRHADRLLFASMNQPVMIDLIAEYYREEGGVMQTINAICHRFQNLRSFGDHDPLANLELSPLRRLSSLLWGYIQDEPNRLTVRRRALEYLHEYGVMPFGRATEGIQPASSRSAFLEAFHNLLYQCTIFFKDDFQTTVISDGYKLLCALRDVHVSLAAGSSNQFADAPWTARVETLLVEYMLARPEIRNFLQAPMMVPFNESWEPSVEAMKTLQGWTDIPIKNFRDLATYGEQLVLSMRYADWLGADEAAAKNWARFWRQEILGYIHAYRAATGVDLTSPEIDATMPAVHLQRRRLAQRTRLRAPGLMPHTQAATLAPPAPTAGLLPSRLTPRARIPN